MKKTLLATAFLLTAIPAYAQNWGSLIPAAGINSGVGKLTLTGGGKNTFGFLDLEGAMPADSAIVDLESFYAEARIRNDFVLGTELGLELNAGTGIEDGFRPHLSYGRGWKSDSTHAVQKSAAFDIKYSPMFTADLHQQQLGVYGNANLGKLGLETWVDLNFDPDRAEGKFTVVGDVTLSYKIKDNIDLRIRGEKRPWLNNHYTVFAGMGFKL